MAASSFVLCLSLVLLVTTQGCSAQLGHTEPATIPTLHEDNNSTVENLRLHGQNTAASSDLQALHSLPDMLQLLKEHITLEIERNMESMKKEFAGLNKVTTLTQENKDLKAQLEARNHTVQVLNTRLQESELRVQELENSAKKINETMECKEKDPECRQTQLQKIKDVVQRFNSSNGLSQLGADLESALDPSSVEHQQLQSVELDNSFVYWLGGSGHTQLVALLLCAGLPVDTTDVYGSTMLHGAAQGGHAQLMKFLLQHGAQVDARGRWQRTPLIWAAFRGRLEVVKVLVEAGANTTAKDEDGFTALEAAKEYSRTSVIQYLQQLQH